MPVGIYDPEQTPSDMSQLKTQAHQNLVAAINELVGVLGVLVDAAEQVAFVSITAAGGAVAIPALPSGAIITGAQAHVSTPFSTGAAIEVGDHSGASGALAPAALTAALGTATTAGDYSSPFFYAPQGALQVALTGAPAAGAAVVLIRYLTPNAVA